MFEDLKIIHYPDPRLRLQSKAVEAFDDVLRALASRMFELMRAQRGVGLAAPQVGQNVRMFVINPTGKPEDDRVYVNPVLVEPDGEDEGEEGCLSLPNVNANVLRSKKLTIRARDLSGQPFEQTESGYVARIWQHENDHLNGVLILDHMSPVAKLGARRALRELRDKWDEEHGT
jgi:peptide deformylase